MFGNQQNQQNAPFETGSSDFWSFFACQLVLQKKWPKWSSDTFDILHLLFQVLNWSWSNWTECDVWLASFQYPGSPGHINVLIFSIFPAPNGDTVTSFDCFSDKVHKKRNREIIFRAFSSHVTAAFTVCPGLDIEWPWTTMTSAAGAPASKHRLLGVEST